MKKNFLITGAGAPGVKGTCYSLKSSLFWEKCKIVGVDINPNAVGKYFLDAFYTVCRVTDSSYNLTIMEIVKKEKIDLIIPQTTNEVVHFSLHKSWFEDNGVKVLTTSYSSINIANNKAKLLEYFEANDIYTPKFKLVRSISNFIESAEIFGYPEKKLVIKSPVSNGSRGVRVLSEKKLSLEKFLNEKPEAKAMTISEALSMFKAAKYFPDILMMEYLPGEEWSVDVFRRSNEKICIIPRIRNIIRSGIAFKSTVVKNDLISDYVYNICNKLSMTTVFGFQFKISEDGRPGLLESNPRVQGTMVASTFAGANVIAMACAEALSLSYCVPTINQIKWGVCFDRVWGGVGVDGNKYIDEI